MIEIIQVGGETVSVNPEHISLVRGFTTTWDNTKRTEILFTSGDWRTFESSYDEIMAALNG